MFGIRLQFAPQLANYDPHIFDFAFRAPLPDRMGEILMSPGLVGMRQQILQYQKLLRRQVADLAMRPCGPMILRAFKSMVRSGSNTGSSSAAGRGNRRKIARMRATSSAATNIEGR
jgi:hypothetical protein